MVDITKPGRRVTDNTSELGTYTAPYDKAAVEDAYKLYIQGPPEMNPLEVDAYNRVAPSSKMQEDLAKQGSGLLSDIISGDSDYLRRKAALAAAARDVSAAGTGTLGGIRSSYARDKAVTDAAIDAQLDAQGRIGKAQEDLQRPIDWQLGKGEKRRQFEEDSPWEWMKKYQDAIQFGEHTPTRTTTVDEPSGADIRAAELAEDLINANINALNNPTADKSAVDKAKDAVDKAKDVFDTAKDAFDLGKDIYDWWKS